MALLPNHIKAELEIAKLRDYCLSPAHPRGRHKARLFASALGLTQDDGAWLRMAILSGLATHDALEQDRDEFGTRWQVDMMVTRQKRRAVIRTIWIERTDYTAPRFVTCWVL